MNRCYIVIFLSFIWSSSHAQNSGFCRFYIGGDFSAGLLNVPLSSISTQVTSGQTQVDFSNGKGIVFGASLGRTINEYLGFQSDVSYLRGSPVELVSSSDIDQKNSLTLSSRFYRIGQSFIVRGFKYDQRVTPFGRLGLACYFGKLEMEERMVSSSTSTYIKSNIVGDIAFGLSSGAGIEIKLMERISLILEINSNNISFFPKEIRAVNWVENDLNVLSDKPKYLKQTIFEKKLTYYSNDPPSELPRKVLRQGFPLGSFGFNLGIKINEFFKN